MSFKHNSSRGLQQKNHRLNTSNSAALLRHVSSTASRSTHCWKKQNRLSLNTNPSLHCVNQFRSRARHWPLQYAGHPGRVKEGSRGRGEWRTPAGSDARQSQVQPVAWRRLHKEKKNILSAAGACGCQADGWSDAGLCAWSCGDQKKKTLVAKKGSSMSNWTLTSNAFFPAACLFYNNCVRACVRGCASQLVREADCSALAVVGAFSKQEVESLLQSASLTMEEGNGVQSPPRGIMSAWRQMRHTRTKYIWESDPNPQWEASREEQAASK